jgi:nucleotide sugar dehydrogenase
MKIGIIGNGYVGKATKLLVSDKNDLFIYDINPKLCSPENLTLDNLKDCDIIFLCLPTPMNPDGSCHLDIVKDTVDKLKNIVNSECCIILRSTVPPNTSNKLNINFMPEFLTEKNSKNDFINSKEWIFGLNNSNNINSKTKIINLINDAYHNKLIKRNTIVWKSNSEAEMIKYFRNSFLAVKVSYCNEFYRLCEKMEISYENVISTAASDTRINQSHTHVPGHDGKFGFGGTCFPKDSNSLLSIFKENNVDSPILSSTIYRNENIDRTEKDWTKNVGRAVI